MPVLDESAFENSGITAIELPEDTLRREPVIYFCRYLNDIGVKQAQAMAEQS